MPLSCFQRLALVLSGALLVTGAIEVSSATADVPTAAGRLTPDGSYGTSGRVVIADYDRSTDRVTVDPSGRVMQMRNRGIGWNVAHWTAAGVLDTFGGGSVAGLDGVGRAGRDGSVLGAHPSTPSGVAASASVYRYLLDGTFVPVATITVPGLFLAIDDMTDVGASTVIAGTYEKRDGGGAVTESGGYVARLAVGALDPSFGVGGFVFRPGEPSSGVVVAPAGDRMLFCTATTTTFLDGAGSVDARYGSGGTMPVGSGMLGKPCFTFGIDCVASGRRRIFRTSPWRSHYVSRE